MKSHPIRGLDGTVRADFLDLARGASTLRRLRSLAALGRAGFVEIPGEVVRVRFEGHEVDCAVPKGTRVIPVRSANGPAFSLPAGAVVLTARGRAVARSYGIAV